MTHNQAPWMETRNEWERTRTDRKKNKVKNKERLVKKNRWDQTPKWQAPEQDKEEKEKVTLSWASIDSDLEQQENLSEEIEEDSHSISDESEREETAESITETHTYISDIKAAFKEIQVELQMTYALGKVQISLNYKKRWRRVEITLSDVVKSCSATVSKEFSSILLDFCFDNKEPLDSYKDDFEVLPNIERLSVIVMKKDSAVYFVPGGVTTLSPLVKTTKRLLKEVEIHPTRLNNQQSKNRWYRHVEKNRQLVDLGGSLANSFGLKVDSTYNLMVPPYQFSPHSLF